MPNLERAKIIFDCGNKKYKSIIGVKKFEFTPYQPPIPGIRRYAVLKRCKFKVFLDLEEMGISLNDFYNNIYSKYQSCEVNYKDKEYHVIIKNISDSYPFVVLELGNYK